MKFFGMVIFLIGYIQCFSQVPEEWKNRYKEEFKSFKNKKDSDFEKYKKQREEELALQGKCKKLYSEDMQHGQKIDGLTIVNPFV